MVRWAAAPMNREQMAMFSPTLDGMVSEDHPVRLFDEILAALDWSEWEAVYAGQLGQPPIHPRILAGVILYGLSLGIRSSRALERACGNCIDFMWLTSGRVIDHSTICQFRTRFSKPLKGQFRQVAGVARGMGLIRLNQVGLDGTRVKANSSRGGMRSAKSLTSEVAVLDEVIEAMFAEAEQADQREDAESSPNHLPVELGRAVDRRDRLAAALAESRARELAKGRAVAVPTADPDSTLQPNKEGGFAPNYTPMAATDGQIGMIVDIDVLADSDEPGQTVATVDRIEENLGDRPERLLADAAHGSGPNLAALAERGVDAYIPMERAGGADNPAKRADPRQPVAQADWDRLPVSPQSKTLDRAGFVYDATVDCYYCPMGRSLPFARSVGHKRPGGGWVRQYECQECGVKCPLFARCVKSKSGLRTISRDEYEPLRDEMEAKLSRDAGRTIYRRRQWLAETPFAVIKARMGVRQFLLRGLAKVRTEWTWVCTAFNLAKLARAIAALRVRLAGMMG